MTRKSIQVRIFTAPDAVCGRGSTWTSAASFIHDRLKGRFGDAAMVEHVEMFSGRSFEFPAVLKAIETGAELPVVVVDGRIVSQGGKLSEGIIARAVKARLDSLGTERESNDVGESA